MTIRAMHMEDYDAVYALWLESTGMGLNDYDDSREGIGRYLRRNPESCFVAEDDGAIVGAVLAGHDGRRGHLNHLAVAPERRRQGLGRALVAPRSPRCWRPCGRSCRRGRNGKTYDT